MPRRSIATLYRPSKSVVRSSGERVRVKTAFYWARYRDGNGRPRQHVLKLPNGERITDRSAAEKTLNDLLRYHERKSAGLIDREVESASSPLRYELAGFIRSLRGRRLSWKHVRGRLSFLKAAFGKGLEFQTLSQFSTEAVEGILCKLAEVHESKNSKKPVTRSPRTLNMYRASLYQFGEWLVKHRRIGANPVRAVDPMNESADVRKQRRSLTFAEATRLLENAGEHRLFYCIALWTGLRCGEIGALTWADIELGGERPCIRLRAAMTKSKRPDELPLHRSLAVLLRKSKPRKSKPSDPIVARIPLRLVFLTACKRAGIGVKSDTGLTVDRHALRTTFVTWLALHGVDPRLQVKLARHSPRGLTFQRYTDMRLFDEWEAINRLPSIPGVTKADAETVEAPAVVELRATGTDDRGAVALPVALASVPNGPKPSRTVRNPNVVTVPCHKQKSLQNKGKTAFLSDERHWAIQDSNLFPPACKAGALTN